MDINSVNAFFGVSPPGNCLVGPYRPFPLVRLGPDIAYPYRDRGTGKYSTSGYVRGEPVVRFSHTHVSGTGGTARYGNIAITPFIGKPRSFDLPPFWAPEAAQAKFEINVETERAEPGYYSLTYRQSEIAVELTTTPRVGLHRYRCPEGKSAWIILDASSVVQPGLVAPGQAYVSTDWDSGPTSIGGSLEVLSDREIWGRSDLRGGWGHDEPYSVYFYLISTKPFCQMALANATSQVWPLPVPGQVHVQSLSSTEIPQVEGSGCRALIHFCEGDEINLKVGVSLQSQEKARESVKQEVGSHTFDEVRSESVEDWNRILGRFEVEGGTMEARKLFASCLYRIFCMPTYLGMDENPFSEHRVPQFTDFYCLWDSVRNANSFFHLFFPALSAQMINALLDIAENTDWLPDAHIAGSFGFMQGGSSADIVLGEAAQKSAPLDEKQRRERPAQAACTRTLVSERL